MLIPITAFMLALAADPTSVKKVSEADNLSYWKLVARSNTAQLQILKASELLEAAKKEVSSAQTQFSELVEKIKKSTCEVQIGEEGLECKPPAEPKSKK